MRLNGVIAGLTRNLSLGATGVAAVFAGFRPRATRDFLCAAKESPAKKGRPIERQYLALLCSPFWLMVATTAHPCAVVPLAAIQAARPSSIAQPVPACLFVTLALKRV